MSSLSSFGNHVNERKDMDLGTDKTIMPSRIILVTRKPKLMLNYCTSAMRTCPKPTLLRPCRFRCRMTRTDCIQTDAEFSADIANGTEIVNTDINLSKELQRANPKASSRTQQFFILAA